MIGMQLQPENDTQIVKIRYQLDIVTFFLDPVVNSVRDTRSNCTLLHAVEIVINHPLPFFYIFK